MLDITYVNKLYIVIGIIGGLIIIIPIIWKIIDKHFKKIAQNKKAIFNVIILFFCVLIILALAWSITDNNVVSTPTKIPSMTPGVTLTANPTFLATSTPITPIVPDLDLTTINNFCTYLQQDNLPVAYSQLFGDHFHRSLTLQIFVNGFMDYTNCTQIKRVNSNQFIVTFDVSYSRTKSKTFTMQKDYLIYNFADCNLTCG